MPRYFMAEMRSAFVSDSTTQVTRQNQGFNESVLHALLMLPVAVTGIVMIVQNARNSIAVAFALTGIVAAVSARGNEMTRVSGEDNGTTLTKLTFRRRF